MRIKHHLLVYDYVGSRQQRRLQTKICDFSMQGLFLVI
jgi:hypothetical protein